MTTMQQLEQQLPYYRWSILWLFLAPALGGFLFGYDIGGTSYVVLELASLGRDSSPMLSLKNAPMKTGWFVAAPSVGALLGTAVLMALDKNQSKRRSNNNNNNNTNIWQRWCSLLPPIGRKTELWCAGILYALGGILECAAGFFSVSVSFLEFSPLAIVFLGRCIYGIAIGFAMHGGPTYLAETTPPSVRGMVVGAKEIAIVVGILSGYMVGNLLCTEVDDGDDDVATSNNNSNTNNGWALVYGCTIPVAILMVVISTTIPESPRYLVSSSYCSKFSRGENESESESESDAKDQKTDDEYNNSNSNNNNSNNNNNEVITKHVSSEVLESLKFVWKPWRASEEHQGLMEVYAKQQQQQQQQESWDENDERLSLASVFSNPSLRPSLKAGLGLVVLQQITGQPSVLSYATPILARVQGLGAGASVLLALFKVLATTISVVLVERYGRKTLLLAGCSLMLVALVVLALAFREDEDCETDDGEQPSNQPLDARSLLALCGMFAYIAGYQIGFGPITWLMISEVFPQSFRGIAVALAVQTNFALNAVVQLLVPILRAKIGMSATFWGFGFLTAYSLWFVVRSVPETRGLTLEEIEEKLASIVKASSKSSPALVVAIPMQQGQNEEHNNDTNGRGEEQKKLLPFPENP